MKHCCNCGSIKIYDGDELREHCQPCYYLEIALEKEFIEQCLKDLYH